MKLLTKALEKKLPKTYGTEEVPLKEKLLICHFLLTDGGFDWYPVEYDKATETFFGYVKGIENEWGYFTLSQLNEVRGQYGLKVERDLYFKPIKFKNL